MADTTIHEIQAAAEGVDIVGGGQKVELLGRKFRIAEKVGLMPLMRFAVAAKAGANADDMESLAAMYGVLKDCIDPNEWPAFEQHAMDTKADGEDLFKVVAEAIHVLSARPTQRPTVSSDGPPTTSPSSKEPSSVRVPDGIEEMVSVTDLLALSTR
ncbi:hypothetical protein ACIBCR_15130 [Micromonospora echinospora]|uniref:hypothetical protein n=1 Tax=Micromonospora echinospora TaxID=1877 RepID=UPI0037A95D29